jgi:hypothetical protein
MPFRQAAYSMRFDFPVDFAPAKESLSLAKKHYRSAIKKLQKYFWQDYVALKEFLDEDYDKTKKYL